MSSIHKPKSKTNLIVGLIMEWLSDQLTTDAFMWLSGKMMRLKLNPTEKQLYMVFSVLPQRVGKDELTVTESMIAIADSYRENWKPLGWHVDEAARTVIILNTADVLPSYLHTINKIRNHRKENDLIALYKALPLYPEPELYLHFATDGIHEDKKSVFEALMLDNPYPYENFDNKDWNAAILRAVTLHSPLRQIIGLKKRMSPVLANEIVSYLEQSWANNENIDPDIWQYIVPSSSPKVFTLMRSILETNGSKHNKEIFEALRSKNDEQSIKLLNDYSR